MRKPFCLVPFVEAFSGYQSTFRDCCATDPHVESLDGQSFADWWQDSRLRAFRHRLQDHAWQPECRRCQLQEQQSGNSFRTEINQQVQITRNFSLWPSRWNLKFGNVCNLACWTCSEQASSVIAQHKRAIKILPVDFVDPEQVFQRDWLDLELSVLKSYDYHDTVTLTLVGGEPMYNRTVARFLEKLIDLDLASRTRLEFHTNGTHFRSELLADRPWNYVCVFVSLDAVGRKAEWLRYGCRWIDIECNIEHFKCAADYVEVHCTLSVLNLCDLPRLKQYCVDHNLPLKISALTDPKFMSLWNWPGKPDLLADKNSLQQHGFEAYYDIVGQNADPLAPHQLHSYISQFNGVRRDLQDYDPDLLHAIKVSKY